MAKVKDLLWTDPDDMLEDDKALIEGDFKKLGSSMATNREFWVASMEVAISAQNTSNSGIIALQIK